MINFARTVFYLLNFLFVIKLDSVMFISNVPIVEVSLLIPLYIFLFTFVTEFLGCKVSKNMLIEVYVCLSIFLLYTNTNTVYFLLLVGVTFVGCYVFNKCCLNVCIGVSGSFNFRTISCTIYNSIICSVVCNVFILYNANKILFAILIHSAIISAVIAWILSYFYNIER